MVDAKKLSATLLGVVRAWVEPAMAAIVERLEAFEARLVAVPAGEKGDPGKDADPDTIRAEVARAVGALPAPQSGAPGRDADPEVIRSMVAEAVAALPPARAGDPGKDADMVEVARMVDETVARATASIPAPKDGKDGKDAEPLAPETARELVVVEVGRAVAALPQPKDGKDADPVHPDTIARMVLEEVQRVVAALPRPADGEPGRDALAVDVLPGIDEAKSYPRGTQAEYRGGEIRAIRNTDPITDSVEKAGWSVIRNGIAEESEETLDEGRTIKRTTVYTNGRELVREIKTSAILYREVWREGEFERGDVVTWGGSAWHCQEPTTDKPGTSAAWKMMVKEGRPGKDGKSAEAAPAAREPVRVR